ncbi:DUF1345 domain-containing protein [Angustibacter sp. Root456]|uniref:DUF1345 domain-containing protein n=1 Tax=Angustibacter sp. Root456 TaxID=1736539 RepID=UPI0009E93B7B|nr:DUF1345 domain-containing protein [Angustibacter sp. Root456]
MASRQGASARSRHVFALRVGRRLAVSAAVGVVVGVAAWAFGGALFAPALAWDAAAATMLAWTWWIIWPLDADDTAAHATREDPSRAASDALLLGAAIASLAAVVLILVRASSTKGVAADLQAALGVLTVLLAWLVVHTVFTLRYARLYYSGTDGGVDFNQDDEPCYSDFGYLGFTVGMAFQVSDTALTTRAMRSTALRHALLSYLFSTVIVATTINLVAGIGSSG